MPASAAAVITSTLVTCRPAAAATRCPGPVKCSRSPIWFAIVPVGTNAPASLPTTSAQRSWSRFTVGSSSYQSSPTSASAIARRIASEGFVTVSERRSTRKELMAAECIGGAQAPPARSTSVEEHRLAVDVADLRTVLVGVVEGLDVDALDTLADDLDRDVHVDPVAKGDEPPVRALQEQVRSHHRIVRRDHQVEGVRLSRAHQIADLLVDDPLAGDLLQGLPGLRADPAELPVAVRVGR